MSLVCIKLTKINQNNLPLVNLTHKHYYRFLWRESEALHHVAGLEFLRLGGYWSKNSFSCWGSLRIEGSWRKLRLGTGWHSWSSWRGLERLSVKVKPRLQGRPLHVGDDRTGGWPLSTAALHYGAELASSWETICAPWMQRGRSRTAQASGVQKIMSELPMSHTELQDLNFTAELGFCCDLIVTVL